jgi:hypothetical protein
MYLGKESCPYGLYFDLCGFDEGVDLVGLEDVSMTAHIEDSTGMSHSDIDAIIGEDEGSVRNGKLGFRHGCGWFGEMMLESTMVPAG